MMLNNKSDSKLSILIYLDDKFTSGAPDDNVNKTIVRIQIKKLKELKVTLEQDLKQKETELERLKQTNAHDAEKATEKELKKSLNILRGLRKKLVKLKQENGSAYEQDIDPIIKAIDKELTKSRKWKPKTDTKEEEKDEDKTQDDNKETEQEETG